MRGLIFTAVLISMSALGAAPMATSTYKASKGIKKLINKAHRDFERCGHAETLRTKKTVKGTILVNFTVNGDGKVAESGIAHNTTKSRPLADCVMRTLESLKFPATFGAPVATSYPFKFDLKK